MFCNCWCMRGCTWCSVVKVVRHIATGGELNIASNSTIKLNCSRGVRGYMTNREMYTFVTYQFFVAVAVVVLNVYTC